MRTDEVILTVIDWKFSITFQFHCETRKKSHSQNYKRVNQSSFFFCVLFCADCRCTISKREKMEVPIISKAEESRKGNFSRNSICNLDFEKFHCNVKRATSHGASSNLFKLKIFCAAWMNEKFHFDFLKWGKIILSPQKLLSIDIKFMDIEISILIWKSKQICMPE